MEERLTTLHYQAGAPCVFCRGEPDTMITHSRDTKEGGLETLSELPCCTVCRNRRERLAHIQLRTAIGLGVLCALLPLLPGDQLPGSLLGAAFVLLLLAGGGFILGMVALIPIEWLLFNRRLSRWLRDYAETQ
jgi:hypothetical protein